MDGTVTALLVSHDGSRWLPQVLDRLTEQTVPPSRVVAVDTGSSDSSVAALRAGLPAGSVILTDQATSFPAAVRAALATLDAGRHDDWIWLLHDDSAPAPDALERLLAATRGPDPAPVLGAKIREWPSLRRLLEVGVTITGTGRRETGLERGEYDQGQHDEERDVLAVNTAGMLVRRSVLEELGFDDELPVHCADVDFGWRAARAGHRVRVVPGAVVFHAEASRNGTRRPEQGRAARRRDEREAALHTVLANCAGPAVPFVAVRLLLGTLLRALGLLLVRAPRESWAELRALAATVLRPTRLRRARSRRRETARVPAGEVRRLLAPPWLPYRHGCDEVGGIAAALVGEAGARIGTADCGPSLGRRALRSPAVWAVGLLTVLSLVAARDLLGGGRLAGGALLPAPDSAADWWRTYLSTTHDVATGSTSTAPAYLLPLAVLASVAAGSASLAVDLLVIALVPLAGAGGYRLLRRLSVGGVVSAAAAVGYAVLLATSGALAQGRLGTLVAAAVLPWLATSALGLAADSADRRRRAAWRTGLWLAVAAAFAPVVWLLTGAVLVGALLVAASGRRFDVRRAGLALLPLPVAVVLLLPWSALVWADRGWAALVLEAGLPASSLVGPVDVADVLAARASHVGAAPVRVTVLTGGLAALALVQRGTRVAVVRCWLVALVALVGVWVLSGLEVPDPLTGGTLLVWAGLPMLVLHGAWLTAVAVAAGGPGGTIAAVAGRSAGWRRPVAVVCAALALVLPVAGAGWWGWHGADDPLERTAVTSVPAYMDAAAERDQADGALLLHGDLTEGLAVEIRRGGPPPLGSEGLVPPAEDQLRLTRAVSDLVTLPDRSTAERLARAGIAFLVVPAPADGELVAALDAVPWLAAASADDPAARAWRVDEPTTLPTPEPGRRTWLRPLLLAGQALALLVVLVLATPSRRREL